MSGSKQSGFVTRNTAEGEVLRIPVGTVRGARPGPQVTIYGGQHGTEYDGVEAVQKLFRELDPVNVQGTIIIALVTNEQAFLNWKQFATTPPEVTDMMRELAQGSEYLINCHGGELIEGMCPYVICRLLGDPELDRKSMIMAESFGVDYISISRYQGEPPAASRERSAWWLWPKRSIGDELGIPEITPEVGQRGSRDEQGIMYRGLVNVLRNVGVLVGKPEQRTFKPRVIGNRHWITSEHQGVFFPEVEVCQDVRKGQRLGMVRDYFGNVLQEVYSPADAKVMNLNRGMPVKEKGFLMWLGEV
ncbi:MAG: succinylglutamate desuccinylase/aspartoacylase family protein [Anaerolineae bacterium]